MRTLLLVLGILILPLVSSGVFADDATTATTNGKSTQQIENTVHQYLIKQPEVVVEALQAYQQKQMKSMEQVVKETQKLAPKYTQDLFRQASDPVVGDTKGKVTLVEFSDYQCPHCVETAPLVAALMKANPNLRVTIKEFPIRGINSEVAARAALAAYKQNKYWEFREALFAISPNGPLTEDKIMDVAKSVGLNVDQLKKDMASPELIKQVQNTQKLAQALKLIGTPAFFIARTDVKVNAPVDDVVYIPGAADQQQLQDIINKMSKS